MGRQKAHREAQEGQLDHLVGQEKEETNKDQGSLVVAEWEVQVGHREAQEEQEANMGQEVLVAAESEDRVGQAPAAAKLVVEPVE